MYISEANWTMPAGKIGKYLGQFKLGICAVDLSETLTHYSVFCGQLETSSSLSLLDKYNIHDPIFIVTFCPHTKPFK